MSAAQQYEIPENATLSDVTTMIERYALERRQRPKDARFTDEGLQAMRDYARELREAGVRLGTRNLRQTAEAVAAQRRERIETIEAQTRALDAKREAIEARLARLRQMVGAATDEEAIERMQDIVRRSNDLPRVESLLAASQAESETARRAALEKQARDDGRLTPSLLAYWRRQPLEAFARFLAVASRVVPAASQQPTPRGMRADLSPAAARYQAMKPAQRAALKKSNPDEYESLRAAAKAEGLVY